MEEAIEKLKSIGHGEINQKTHIASNKILYILNRDYERFDKTTAIGFIRILEREYNVDLSEWVKEFEAYIVAHGKAEEAPLLETNLVDVQVSRAGKKGGAGRFFWSVVLLGALGGGGYYLYQYHFEEIVKLWPIKKEEKSIEPILSNANESIQTARILTGEAPLELGITPKIETPIDESTTAPLEPALKAAIDEAKKVDVSNTLESQSSALPLLEANVTRSTLASEPENTPALMAPKEVIFQVKNKVWLGIVYLDKKEKVAETVSGQYKLNPNRSQLIITGHGMLEVKVDGRVESYNSGAPMRFRYTPEEGLSVITLEEFKAQNGGKEW